MGAHESDHVTPGLLQIALLVTTDLARVHVERQRAAELGRMLRSGQILARVVGHDGVFLVPLAIRDVLLEPVVQVPRRDVARGVGPNAAVQRQQHRQAVLR